MIEDCELWWEQQNILFKKTFKKNQFSSTKNHLFKKNSINFDTHWIGCENREKFYHFLLKVLKLMK
jgi:hypothetical protein